MLMNSVTLKPQDKSVAKISDPARVPRDDVASAPISKGAAPVPVPKDGTVMKAVSGDDLMAPCKGGTALGGVSGGSFQEKCPATNQERADFTPPLAVSLAPEMVPSNPNILSKRSRPEGELPNTISLPSGSGVPSISRFLYESHNINDPGLETRPQLESYHAMYMDSVAKVEPPSTFCPLELGASYNFSFVFISNILVGFSLVSFLSFYSLSISANEALDPLTPLRFVLYFQGRQKNWGNFDATTKT